jgi:hypothetical protein
MRADVEPTSLALSKRVISLLGLARAVADVHASLCFSPPQAGRTSRLAADARTAAANQAPIAKFAKKNGHIP